MSESSKRACLKSSFQLNLISDTTYLDKSSFPTSAINVLTSTKNGKTFVFAFDRFSGDSEYRTRNRFIIARSHLESLVRNSASFCFSVISKIISKIWKTDQTSFKNYYQYLADLDSAYYWSSVVPNQSLLDKNIAVGRFKIQKTAAKKHKQAKKVKKINNHEFNLEMLTSEKMGLITQDLFLKKNDNEK